MARLASQVSRRNGLGEADPLGRQTSQQISSSFWWLLFHNQCSPSPIRISRKPNKTVVQLEEATAQFDVKASTKTEQNNSHAKKVRACNVRMRHMDSEAKVRAVYATNQSYAQGRAVQHIQNVRWVILMHAHAACRCLARSQAYVV